MPAAGAGSAARDKVPPMRYRHGSMTPYLAAYAGTALTMVALDLVWLGVLARPWYQQGIGHLMVETPHLPTAAVFYGVYALGLVLFAVKPPGQAPGWARTVATAALFGFFAYATYDLTNLATLRDWPLGLSLLDMAWGTLVSAAAAAAGKAAMQAATRRQE